MHSIRLGKNGRKHRVIAKISRPIRNEIDNAALNFLYTVHKPSL